MLITTFEHAHLTQNNFINPSDFDWLLEQNFDGLSIERKHKQWLIKNSHYIGVIGLPSGHQLEILPKISDIEAIQATRYWLQQMLQDTWQSLKPKQLPNISHQTPLAIQPNLPLSDWLQGKFWQLWQSYQPNHDYQRFEQNQAYLQGKLLIKQQLQHNAHQPHKFFNQTEVFVNDTACNRLVKTAFQTVVSRIHSLPLPSQWRQVKIVLPIHYQATFTQAMQELSALPSIIATQNLAMIDFCYTLLTLQQATGQGQTSTSSLLINMQFAFEKWVTFKIQQHFPHDHIVPQKSQALTADYALTIKPDIWLKTQKGVQVFDIKWKNIRDVADISLADMYQLMTYASEFEASDAWLIVPTQNEYMKKQQIVLIKSNPCRFWLVPFWAKEGQLLTE